MKRLGIIRQKDWHDHVNAKFKQYERGWNDAYAQWQRAKDRGDVEGTVAAFEEQAIYFRAEKLANRDMSLPKDQWEARWDADYLSEARSQLQPSTDLSLSERLEVAEKFFRAA